MYDSKKLKEDIPITLDYILSRVSEYDIYARYLGQFKVGFIYNSPSIPMSTRSSPESLFNESRNP